MPVAFLLPILYVASGSQPVGPCVASMDDRLTLGSSMPRSALECQLQTAFRPYLSSVLRLQRSLLSHLMVLHTPWVNVLILIYGFSVTAATNPEKVVVQTDKGAVRGTVSDGVAAFRGIPYAAPPTGALRWQDPQPAVAWNGTRDALSDGAACPQDCALPTVTCPTKISESCLFLNVFAPAPAPAPRALRPIMVFLHGGNFYQGYGGGILYDGSHFVRDHGVVVVALNYRLGRPWLLAYR